MKLRKFRVFPLCRRKKKLNWASTSVDQLISEDSVAYMLVNSMEMNTQQQYLVVMIVKASAWEMEPLKPAKIPDSNGIISRFGNIHFLVCIRRVPVDQQLLRSDTYAEPKTKQIAYVRNVESCLKPQSESCREYST